MKLKEDEDGNKISEVRGIRAACKIMKTRYAKPFESVQVKIPYETGMSPYSGLVDFCEAKAVLTKSGNRLQYIDKETGEAILKFRKAWESNEDGVLDLIMRQWNDYDTDSVVEELNTQDDVQNILEDRTDYETK
jgi:hypothetical protein